MGQKVKPIGLRLGINRTWDSRWFAEKNYSDLLHKDLNVRKYLMNKLKAAAVSKVVIERPAGRARVSIYSGRPGLIIGKKGQDIEKLKDELSKKLGMEVSLNIMEIRTMKRSVQSAMRLGAAGVRINCAGRLGGAEIARTEWYREGRVPLHTLRADVDYGEAEANTTYGICGIKVWIFKGEIMEHDPLAQEKRLNEVPGQVRN